MQGQRYAYMTPSMACADGGGSGKSNQGRKGRDKTTEKKTKTILCMKVIFASSAGLAKHQSN